LKEPAMWALASKPEKVKTQFLAIVHQIILIMAMAEVFFLGTP
jgi:hypothetical protein